LRFGRAFCYSLWINVETSCLVANSFYHLDLVVYGIDLPLFIDFRKKSEEYESKYGQPEIKAQTVK